MVREGITIVLGLAAGAIGAALVTAKQAPAHPAIHAPPSAHSEPIVPPGWDPQYVGHLADLESRVERLSARPASTPQPVPTAPASTVPPAGPIAVAERERDRQRDYDAQLERQEQAILDHRSEALDPAWARDEEHRLNGALEPTLDAKKATLKSLDCRSATCVLELTFPTPAGALRYLASDDVRAFLPFVHGMSSVPAPPSGGGEYDLQIVLNR
jgi:hypothetical protein